MALLLQKRGMTNTDHPIKLLIMTSMCDCVCVLFCLCMAGTLFRVCTGVREGCTSKTSVEKHNRMPLCMRWTASRGKVSSEAFVTELGFSGGSMVKNTPANGGDVDLIPGLERFPGEENGNPLQYSCLENPMDRGAWQATARGVTKRQTQLSN